jgi:hypothetical protein
MHLLPGQSEPAPSAPILKQLGLSEIHPVLKIYLKLSLFVLGIIELGL